MDDEQRRLWLDGQDPDLVARERAPLTLITEERSDEPTGEQFNHEFEEDSDEPSDGSSSGPNDLRIFPSPTEPYAVAELLYQGCCDPDGVRNLLAYRGSWQLWRQTHWAEVDIAEVKHRLYRELKNAVYIDKMKIKPWAPNKSKIANVIDGMAAIGHLSSETDAPAWVDTHKVTAAASQMISCRNGLLNLTTRTLHPHTPALYNYVRVPFDYHTDAGEPTVWLAFLRSVWADDDASIRLLQQWFGYVISGRMEQQKLLALIGPSRSGKGTIANVLAGLMGGAARPTMSSFATNFGCAPLIGKPLAVISDARLGRANSAVVERLLNITGEDALDIDRKYQTHWNGKLPTRFMILSNELPRFDDSSGVIASRFMILRMTESYLGQEDYELPQKLRPELPGILNWALQGLDDLNAVGRFSVPKSSHDAVVMLQDMASPVSAFVRDECVCTPDAMIRNDVMYQAYKDWCERNGHKATSQIVFGRDLRSVAPRLGSGQPTIDGKRVRCYTGIELR